MEQQERKTEMSLGEKQMCLQIMGEQPMLPYPLKEFTGSDGFTYQEYDIPEDKRAEVLKKLYPMGKPPKLDAAFLDVHEMRIFALKDYRVLRYGESNILVSPYFDRSGGMFVDWQPQDTVFRPCYVQTITIFNGKPIKSEEE